jgi:hypothetical protein
MANCRFDVPSYTDLGCNIEGGRVVAFALVDKDHTLTTPDQSTEWLNASYDSDVIIFKEVSGSYSKPSANEVPGKGSQQSRTVGRDHELSLMIEGVKDNTAFWNAVNKSNNYRAAWVTGSDYQNTTKTNAILYITDVSVSVDAGIAIPEDLNGQVQWEVSVKWSDLDAPATYDVPSGVFED